MKKIAKFGMMFGCVMCLTLAVVLFAACGSGVAQPTREITKLGAVAVTETADEETNETTFGVRLAWLSQTDRAFEPPVESAAGIAWKGFYGYMVRYKGPDGQWQGSWDVVPTDPTKTKAVTDALPAREATSGTDYGQFILCQRMFSDLTAGTYTFEVRALYTDVVFTFEGGTPVVANADFEYGPTATTTITLTPKPVQQ